MATITTRSTGAAEPGPLLRRNDSEPHTGPARPSWVGRGSTPDLVIALGVAWVLDGLEITIASNAEGLISQKQALNLSSSEVAFAVGTVYLLGEVAGPSSSAGCRTSSAGATCS